MKTKLALVMALMTCLTVGTTMAQAAACSLGSVAGDFAYSFWGFVTSPATGAFVPAAAAGRATFDGHGNITGAQTRVVAGTALEETYSGTYTVNPDCRGSFTVLVQPDTRTSTVDVVWANNTNDASMVFGTPGFTLSGAAKRITPRH